jgi:hypothetical protein
MVDSKFVLPVAMYVLSSVKPASPLALNNSQWLMISFSANSIPKPPNRRSSKCSTAISLTLFGPALRILRMWAHLEM